MASRTDPHALQVQTVHTRCISRPQLLIDLLSEIYASGTYRLEVVYQNPLVA